MPEPSNPTSRVVDVLNFLAAHPTEAFSLAELARHLGLSNGSAHRILTTLSSAHFLSRDAKRRTYSLGRAMVAIGQAAVETHRGIDVARRELARLAGDLNVQCSANAVVDDEILVLVKEGAAQSHRGLTRVGERRPLVPPLGLCHVAWGGEQAIAAYVAAAAPHLGDAAFARLHAAFPLIRQRGFAMAAHGPGAGQLTPDELQLIAAADAGPGGVGTITAPVFSPTGEVSLQLVLSGLPSHLGAHEIARYAEKLCATAASITSETHGRKPPQRTP